MASAIARLMLMQTSDLVVAVTEGSRNDLPLHLAVGPAAAVCAKVSTERTFSHFSLFWS